MSRKLFLERVELARLADDVDARAIEHGDARRVVASIFDPSQAVAPGFDSTQVVSARLTLPAKRFNTRDAIVTFQRALARQLSSLLAAYDDGVPDPVERLLEAPAEGGALKGEEWKEFRDGNAQRGRPRN